jgi:hypothetical protein
VKGEIGGRPCQSALGAHFDPSLHIIKDCA